MSQPAITSFFGSKKRRATEQLLHDAKICKLDKDSSYSIVSIEKGKQTNKEVQRTPIKGSTKACDIRSYLTSAKSPHRPEVGGTTSMTKLFLPTTPSFSSPSTPVSKTPRTPGSILRRPEDTVKSSATSVKKTIRFDENVKDSTEPEKLEAPKEFSTEDLIEAANKLVSKLKEKKKALALDTSAKKVQLTQSELSKRSGQNVKLTELNASLARLAEHASNLIQVGKKKVESNTPKLTKFDSIDIDVPRSPHKGALASPVKCSPKNKPAYERYSHLIASPVKKTNQPNTTLTLPFGFQRLLELFSACDTVCSMMTNRKEIVTFRKLKPSVQEMTRLNFTERHLAQIAAVMPEAFSFHMEKLRNFGSTSKIDRYELVITPLLTKFSNPGNVGLNFQKEEDNLIQAAERKKITPKMLNERKTEFHKILLNKTIEQHDLFLAGLDPPITVQRQQLARWHPNFLVDLVPDIPPMVLPQPPDMEKPNSAKEILEKAKTLLSSNKRMLKALDAAAEDADTIKKESQIEISQSIPPSEVKQELNWIEKKKIDKKIEKQNPLRGISKSLLEKIRAKQAAKALDTMCMTQEQLAEEEIFAQLPDIARTVRAIFMDNQKSVLTQQMLLDKMVISSKRHLGKGEAEVFLKRLLEQFPEWITTFEMKNIKYVKIDRTVSLTPLLENMKKK